LSTDWIIVLQWRTMRELSLQWEIICKTCVYTNTTKYILIHICIIKELTKYINFMHKKLLFSLRHIITDIPVNYHFPFCISFCMPFGTECLWTRIWTD
jgi:hypothetical protein